MTKAFSMTKTFSALSLALGLPLLAPSAAQACWSADCPVSLQQTAGWQEFLPDVFNPHPSSELISRTRMEVFVTDERTQCYRGWSSGECFVVLRADGTREGMVIGNYTHSGPTLVTVERIEYSHIVTAFDGWPIHFVAVEE